jgi:hypothetical protein
MARKLSRSVAELSLLQETEVDLVNKRRGRERVTRRFTAQLPPGYLTQLVVIERDESLERITIACAPARQPLCDLATRHDRPHCQGSRPPS